jgi:hypothetical protein
MEIQMTEIEREKLIKEAHIILDRIEKNIRHIVESIKKNKLSIRHK